MNNHDQYFDPSNLSKKDFVSYYLAKSKELGKRQRKYKEILQKQVKGRKQTILESNHRQTNEQLRAEKDDLRAQIWVASGVTHKRTNQKFHKDIRCHIHCQEHLSKDIRKLKEAISNIERQTGHINKKIIELNKKTVPETQYQFYVANTRKTMHTLQSQLEVSMRRECVLTAANANLREELINMLNVRTFFNDEYSKLIQKLGSDKKYITDLIDYAMGSFDNCIELYDKMDTFAKRKAKELEAQKIDLQRRVRRAICEDSNNKHFDCRNQKRELPGIHPKEADRREVFRRQHIKKINLYNEVLDKILRYTKSRNVRKVIDKFKQQESLYYSYFTYVNETSFHMTLLNGSVDRLFRDIRQLKNDNRSKKEEQLETIEKLQNALKEQQDKNAELDKTQKAGEKRLENLLQGFEAIFDISRTASASFTLMLGDQDHINLNNIELYCSAIEDRLKNVIASVYTMERIEDKDPSEYVVKNIEKFWESQTDLKEIVPVQQCPECAEADAYNVDDAGDGVAKVYAVNEIKKKLQEKVNQPEMHYRLHSISQCRLPRSRMLAAKRNT